MGWRAALAVVSLVTSVTLATALSAQEGRAWRPEERVVLTSFHLVSGVTRDGRRLYAASEGGLQMLDLFSGRWEMPSTVEDGYPVNEGPTAVVYDDAARIVWLGTSAGSLHTFQVDFSRWRLESSPGLGPVLKLFPFSEGLDDGVYVRTPTGWFRYVRTGGWIDPVSPDELPTGARLLEVSAEVRLGRVEPAFAAAGRTLTADEGGRAWPITDFVRADGPNQYWLATAGNNLYHYDARFYEARPVPFGLLTPGSAALAGDSTGFWSGGDGRGPRQGPVHGSWDLQRWSLYESGVGPAPPGRIADVLVTPEAVWFGAPSGLHRYEPATETWSQVGGATWRLGVRRVSPATGGGVWAATERGLLRVSSAGDVIGSTFDGRAIRAVTERDGVIWVGGEAGLVRMDPEGRVGAPQAGAPPPPGPIVDVVDDQGDLWAATPDALWRYDGRRWEGPLREAPSLLGRVQRLRVTGGGLWATGDGGAGRRVRDGSGWNYLLLDRDLPAGPAFDVLVTPGYVHVATPAGVVRLERRRGY